MRVCCQECTYERATENGTAFSWRVQCVGFVAYIAGLVLGRYGPWAFLVVEAFTTRYSLQYYTTHGTCVSSLGSPA